jgi:hypothetical protein
MRKQHQPCYIDIEMSKEKKVSGEQELWISTFFFKFEKADISGPGVTNPSEDKHEHRIGQN